MANDHYIKNYSAADIERYHRGLLSSKEMHAMEKAALDDPFLADAMEGYSLNGVNAATDLAELQEKLNRRTAGAKVITMEKDQRTNYRWLRVAAMIFFVAGAGLLIYQFGFNKKPADIAQADTKKNETVRATDSPAIKTPVTTTVPAQENGSPVASTQGAVAIKPVGTSTDQTVSPETGKENSGERSVAANKNPTGEKPNNLSRTYQPTVPAPAKAVANDEAKSITANNSAGIKEGSDETRSDPKGKLARQQSDKDIAKDREAQNEDLKKQAAASRKADEQYYRDLAANTFRGRVTDASDVGVPFANVTNVQDNAGTYTDANGNFILTSPDSILTVNIRSIGFENNNAQLRNNVANNRVVLQDDRRSVSELVVSNQKPNTVARSGNMNVKLEEPEPADGWDNYDAYLVNNLNIPEEYKTKKDNTASVELSFEVDKNGAPINIKIERSLCATCDKEAIRLVKQGPKWKRKAKKGRTTVTVPFSSSF